MQEAVCINGEIFNPAEARISAFDSGFLQGVGLFETMRAYAGRVFRLDAHLDRMITSARTLGWTVLPAAADLTADVQRTLEACGSPAARVRLTVTTGSIRADASDVPQLTIVVSAAAGGGYPADMVSRGSTAYVSRFRQSLTDPTTGHKTTSYFARLTALRAAHAAGALEALWFTDDGRLAEGSISNVFLVIDGELHTPPLSTPILPGITRAVVLESARAAGLPVCEEPLQREDLLEADEVFVTNSMMEVLPVVRIERVAIGNEKPGAITMQMREAYQARVREECGSAAYE